MDDKITKFLEMYYKLMEEYGGVVYPEREDIRKMFELSERINDNYEKYDVVDTVPFDKLNNFKLDADGGGIPLVSFNGKEWVKEYFIPSKVVRDVQGRRIEKKGWKTEVNDDFIKYKKNVFNSKELNRVFFTRKINEKPSDNHLIVNFKDDMVLTEEELKVLTNTAENPTPFGLVPLSQNKWALVPYKLATDKHAQTFFSFEIETKMKNRNIAVEIVNDYKNWLTKKWKEKYGVAPTWRELGVSEPRGYFDVGAVEMVNTGFSLTNGMFFMDKYVDLMEEFVDENVFKKGSEIMGTHFNATIRSNNERLLKNYLYIWRMLDTILFRGGKRLRSANYLEDIGYLRRGLFRAEVNTHKLEVRYPGSAWNKKYLMNMFILTQKYVNDINKLDGMVGDRYFENEASGSVNPDTTKSFRSEIGRQYLDFYLEEVLHIKDKALKKIMLEQTKICSAM